MIMYAHLGRTKGFYTALEYNEAKLRSGEAEMLLAENFVKDLHQLSEMDKLDRFLQRISLNENATDNMLPISINFETSEKISNDQMRILAIHYMTDMGLGKQPFLVYRHYDSGHPHCHILTTKIQADGRRIDLRSPDYHKSHQITKKLEQEFSLIKHERVKQEDEEKFKVQHAQRVLYGKSPLKHSLSDVLNTIVDHYRYTSLTELNAILRLYNVQATRGKEGSRLYQYRGLQYYALDESGKRKGKSIKASDFFLKPTLARLEENFKLNLSLREVHSQRVKSAIDWTLSGNPPDWKGFQQSMEREGIHVVVQADKKGGPEGVFFVDHESKCVFGGEGLGERYRLESVQERCAAERQEEVEEESLRQRLYLGL
jgi:hypothetical protein